MKEPRHDDERLSALLAGRLEGPERDELLAHLSTADEDYEVFANAAAILREMDEEDAAAEEARIPADPPPRRELPPPSTMKPRPPRWAVPRALAGLVVLMGFVGLGWWLLSGREGYPGRPVQVVAALERPNQVAPGAWPEVRWSAPTRGPGAPARNPAAAAQAGSYLVRLAVAVQARDAAATSDLTTRMKGRFDPQGGDALEQIAARAGGPPADLEPLLERATDRLEKQLGREHLRLGAWTEAARLAAETQDAAFFRTEDSRAMLDSAEDLTGADPRAQAAVAAVRAALPATGTPEWTALRTGLTALLTEIGTEQS